MYLCKGLKLFKALVTNVKIYAEGKKDSLRKTKIKTPLIALLI